jgi:phage baseplate assembly protein W
MEEGEMFGRGISFPPRIGSDGRMSWSAGPQNIRESIKVILLTEPQERLMLPEMGTGLRKFLFEPNTAATHRLIQEQINQSLELWEPRISLESVAVEPDTRDEQAVTITITYQLVATGESDQVGLTVRLGSQP